jgi:hypothetical protein
MARAALVGLAALALAAPALGASVTRTATTASYKLVLDVGPVETMYTQAEVQAKHPKTGEVMVGGGMGMAGMSMGSGNRHLEVHVYSRATGKVLAKAPSSIRLTDESAMGSMAMPVKVGVVAMEGVGEGRSDLHYGDNVHLTVGHTYKVVVTVGGEKATFTFRA